MKNKWLTFYAMSVTALILSKVMDDRRAVQQTMLMEIANQQLAMSNQKLGEMITLLDEKLSRAKFWEQVSGEEM